MKELGPKVLETFRAKTIEEVLKLSNRNLFDTTLSLSTGDDYDGCFTITGQIEYVIHLAELESRLSGWLES